MKNNQKNTVIAVLSAICIILLLFLVFSGTKNHVLDTNLKAAKDSIETIKLKNGDLLYEKKGYLLKTQELEEMLEINKKERKELEKKLSSSLASIAVLKGQIKTDTIYLNDTAFIDKNGVFKNKFDYSDEWFSLKGTSVYNGSNFKTSIDNISMEVPLKIGTTKDHKWFVTSENPYIVFTDIDGAELNNIKQKRWGLGIQLGVGAFTGYGATRTSEGIMRSGLTVGVGLYLGIGINYRIL